MSAAARHQLGVDRPLPGGWNALFHGAKAIGQEPVPALSGDERALADEGQGGAVGASAAPGSSSPSKSSRVDRRQTLRSDRAPPSSNPQRPVLERKDAWATSCPAYPFRAAQQERRWLSHIQGRVSTAKLACTRRSAAGRERSRPGSLLSTKCRPSAACGSALRLSLGVELVPAGMFIPGGWSQGAKKAQQGLAPKRGGQTERFAGGLRLAPVPQDRFGQIAGAAVV